MKIINQSNHLDLSEKLSPTVVGRDGTVSTSSDTVVREHFLDIYINEKLVTKLVCTPQDIPELVVGRLISDGYINHIDEIKLLYICSYASKAKVFLYEEPDLKQAVSMEPTCCTGNQVVMQVFREREPDVLMKGEWKPEWVFDLADHFASGTKIHKITRGTHGCYLSVRGEVVYVCEDIGRHNALDKAIGCIALRGYEKKDCILFTTGRVPTDMVKKVILSKIPVLVSKSTPTNEAVDLAKRYNLTLICNAWPDQYEIYSESQ